MGHAFSLAIRAFIRASLPEKILAAIFAAPSTTKSEACVNLVGERPSLPGRVKELQYDRTSGSSYFNDERVYRFATPSSPCEGIVNLPVTRVTAPNGTELWLVSGYSEVRTVLNDRRFSSAAAAREGAPRLALPLPASNIFKKDAPEHTRLRRLVGRAFTARRIQEMRPYVQQTADRLLDEMTQDKNQADLVSEFFIPLSMGVMCHLLGVPYEDRARFGEWTQVTLLLQTSDDAVWMARARLDVYLKHLIAQKRDQPGDDLLFHAASGRAAS